MSTFWSIVNWYFIAWMPYVALGLIVVAAISLQRSIGGHAPKGILAGGLLWMLSYILPWFFQPDWSSAEMDSGSARIVMESYISMIAVNLGQIGPLVLAASLYAMARRVSRTGIDQDKVSNREEMQ